MQFHLPKPLHGWREFSHEVLIIVFGVLVALGLEQIVSSAHDRASAAETRANIRSEMVENLRLMLRRQRTDICVQRRMREIAAFLGTANQGQHAKQPAWIGAPYAPLMSDTVFKSAQSAGKYALLPQSEQQKIEEFYNDGNDFNEQNTREWYDWAQLRSLTDPAARLTDGEITRLRQALQDARGADWLIREDTTDYIKMARDSGIVAHDHSVPDDVLAPACLPISTPYAEAAAKVNRKELGFPE